MKKGRHRDRKQPGMVEEVETVQYPRPRWVGAGMVEGGSEETERPSIILLKRLLSELAGSF